jgi:DNA-directed RNA polymerase subunit beta
MTSTHIAPDAATSVSAGKKINPSNLYGKIPEILAVPNLIELQIKSFNWFLETGLRALLDEISPIKDFNEQKMDLRFCDYILEKPKHDEDECRDKDLTFAAPLKINIELEIKETGEIKEQQLFFGDFPLMTERGTFIVNGAERVVVSQLVRSPGVYYTADPDPQTGKILGAAKLIPSRGAWLEFETSNRSILSVKVDRKRKIPVSILIRTIDIPGILPGDRDNPMFSKYFELLEEEGTGKTKRSAGFNRALREIEEHLGTTDRLQAIFKDVDVPGDNAYLRSTIEVGKDTTETKREALIEFYRRIRPGEPPTLENARKLIDDQLFFNPRRYDLGKVGRYQFHNRIKNDAVEYDDALENRCLRPIDLVNLVAELINVNVGRTGTDDIDHLGNRRIRAVGELIQQQFRVGLLRMERVVRERMTITDPAESTPSALINTRPVVATTKEFFGGSQLSQFMDQTNPLAELTHKRRLSALGPGGLSRDRAGFDVRDVHHSHYGRICPIETPEGPNIGLIGSLATYGRLNDYGFIETPYRRVVRELSAEDPDLCDNYVRGQIKDSKGKIVVNDGEKIDVATQEKLKSLGVSVPIRPRASDDIAYLDAKKEDAFTIGQANAVLDDDGFFLEERVEVRDNADFKMVPPYEIDYLDISPKQMVSVASALIPFLEHDDANRALMGANMQRQAVPLVRPEAPLVGTGMESRTAIDSGHVRVAKGDGEIVTSNSKAITLKYDDQNLGSETIYLDKFKRSNQGTCINQRPIVLRGERVSAGQALVDSSSTDGGELALGQNVLCAFMSWDGYNFEDAIIISQNLVREDKFTSIHVEKHEIEARDTKLGEEEITRDIPNVGEEGLADLDEDGIVRIGAEVREGDLLVGKITPKGETELSAEEKLLRAIFGEKARDVKDSSLRLPHGERGKVIGVSVLTREDTEGLAAQVNKLVRVSTAQRRKISEGDKMAGRHGNKGVISRILPREDMPFLPDGTPIDIILNPIGVPSRMNIGQVLETHLGMAAQTLGFRATTPVFDGADDEDLDDALARAWMASESGAVYYIDPRSQGFDLDLACEWVKENGYDPVDCFGTPSKGISPKKGAAKRACLEIWLEQIGHSVNKKDSIESLEEVVQDIYRTTGANPPLFGKTHLRDGRTGEYFDQPVCVGQMYMLKLIHLVEDKIHARSTGPYSLITQQPLGGKAQFGGQRFGEMEVWALEAYGAAHVLQELLTVKSDDVVGRVKTYEAIVKGEDVLEPGVPESFKVLVKELQSLGLSVDVSNAEGAISFASEADNEPARLGINLTGLEEEDIFDVRS